MASFRNRVVYPDLDDQITEQNPRDKIVDKTKMNLWIQIVYTYTTTQKENTFNVPIL